MIAEPELYALAHRGTPGDVDFYLDACRGADPLLELGCGYGRLLLPLARAGHRVWGVEHDPGLLALARAAVAGQDRATRGRVTLLPADMRTLDLGQRFARVLIPFSGLYCLPDEAAQVRCLAGAARHLAPDGRLVLDAWPADDFHAHGDPADDERDDGPVVSLQWRGRLWDVHERSRWERGAQRLDVRYEYRPRDGGAARADVLGHRYVLTRQMPALLEAAGLALIACHGDFHGTPWRDSDEHRVYVAAPR